MGLGSAINAQLGQVWWDLTTVRYIDYDQGDDAYKIANWGKLAPGTSIDVYEWVGSSYLPSQWAALADTVDGLTQGVSGQPKFPDNSVMSVKQVYNSVSNAFDNGHM